jgi:hypothetical protein
MMKPICGNPLQLVFVVWLDFVAKDAGVESRMHGQAVATVGEMLQGVTDASSEANVAAKLFPDFPAHGLGGGFRGFNAAAR